MSLAIENDMQELLKNSAKKTGMSVSQLVRELVESHLDLIVNDGNEIPVILRIPVHLKGDRETLKSWLGIKVDAIVNALS